MAAPRDSKGRFLPRGSSGGGASPVSSTVADDLDSVTSSLGITDNAATSLTETLASLGVAGNATTGWLQRLLGSLGAAGSSAFGRVSGAANGLAGGLSDLLSSSTANTIATEGLTAAMGPYGQIVEVVIQRVTFLAGVMKDAAAMAIRLTQEDDALRSSLGALAGGGDEAGQAIMDLIDGLGDLPFAAGALEGWAKSLLSAGVQGERLETGLRAIAAATAIMGKGGTAAAEGLIKRFHMMAEAGQKVTLDRRIMGQLAQAGVTVADLAKQLGVPAEKLAGMALDADKLGVAMQNALITKGVGPLQRMGQTFESMRSKIVDAFEDAFANLGDLVRPFMAEVQSLASEFFKGSVASTTFSGAVKGILTPTFEIATKAVRGMHIALLYVEIGYLKAVIAMRPVSEFLGTIATRAEWLRAVMYVLTGAAIALTIVLAALAVAVFLVALPFIVAAAAIVLLVIGLIKLGGVIDGAISNLDNIGNKVSETGASVVDSVTSMVSGAAAALFGFPLAAAQAGVNFVTGLIQAITSGQGPVADAVRQLARGAISAITGAFQTRSPSRVTAKIGGYFTEGLAGGIDDGAGDVEAAAGGAGDAAVGGLKSGMRKSGGGGGRGGGKGMIAQTIQFIYQGPADQFDDFAERAEKWLEQMAGEGPDPEPAT